MKRIGFIGCSKNKSINAKIARDLYSSTLFKYSLNYALNHYDETYILSAKYGLVYLNQNISYYDETLNCKSKEELIKWSKFVSSQIKSKVKYNEDDRFYFLTGKKYYKYLLPLLKPNECIIECEGFGIGKRLKWLKSNNAITCIDCEDFNLCFISEKMKYHGCPIYKKKLS